MNKFPRAEKAGENAQFVISCNRYYVNKMCLRLLVHNCPALWKTTVENSVENVEKSGFSTVIFLIFLGKRAVDKSVETGDNSRFIHSREVVMSQEDTGEGWGKTGSKVGFCRLFGEVEDWSKGTGCDKLCEKPPKADGLPPFPPDVSISHIGKYCGGNRPNRRNLPCREKWRSAV